MYIQIFLSPGKCAILFGQHIGIDKKTNQTSKIPDEKKEPCIAPHVKHLKG